VDLHVKGALIILALVAGVAHAQVMSPGPLVASHASIDSDDDCEKCHESGNRVVANLCLGCHKELGAKLSAGTGLHGRQYKGQACEKCHVEHLGRNAHLIRWPGGDASSLDHDLTGYKLAGGHKQVTCSKCHTQKQYVVVKTTCAGCHKDPHAGRFTTSCTKCHSETDWKGFDRKQFDHALAKFQLTGKHAEVACEKCHGKPEKWTGIAFSTCESCHQDPHKGELKGACSACHDTGGWASASAKMKDDHPWLSLRNGHAKVGCKTCHDKGDDKPPSKGTTCNACHKPVHVAKFSSKCEGCHASIRWVGLPDSVGRDHHGETRYPLAGKHVSVDCGRCHDVKKPAASRWKNLAFDACTACHADKHTGEFAARDKGECAQCHTLDGFARSTFGVTQHATTAFALDGRHVATRCSACHTKSKPWLDLRVGKSACADCHDNPHGTQFDTEMAKGGCATCHATNDWHRAKFDHSTYPLLGAHERTACTGCHGEQKPGAPPAAYRGIPRLCDGCHDDSHAGQFRLSEPVKDCPACHDPRDKTGFKIDFDHGKTTYPLDGKHRAVQCAACHPRDTLRNGANAIRYRLGYHACKDCHANPHTVSP
jgi:hypothetical protein